jgi:hypothetical protein
MKPKTIVLCLVFVLVAAFAVTKNYATVVPPEGFVPDANKAIKIAVAIWEPIFGRKEIASEMPCRAKLLTNTVWVVEGSLPKGGVAIAYVAKGDARVSSVYLKK